MSLNIREPKYSTSDLDCVDVILDHPEFGEIAYTFSYSQEDQSLDSDIRAALEELTIAPFEGPSEEEEILASFKSAENYLTKTDWVVNIAEAQILGEDISSLTTKYYEILTSRNIARDYINDHPPEQEEE
jgi:hypothetical protein